MQFGTTINKITKTTLTTMKCNHYMRLTLNTRGLDVEGAILAARHSLTTRIQLMENHLKTRKKRFHKRSLSADAKKSIAIFFNETLGHEDNNMRIGCLTCTAVYSI